jgi:hypothetical protein
MTTGLTYSTYVTQIATMAVINSYDLNDPTDPFTIIIPQMINYAELRMQRDIDFLNTVNTSTYIGTAGTNTVSLGSTYPFVTVQNIAVTDPTTGYVNQLMPVTKEWMWNVYPVGSSQALPQYFAPFDDNLFLLGPVPNQAYTYSVTGTSRFPTLTSSNSTTFISTYLPDVFIMASMIYISAYQRNFGKAVDDPAMAVTYESQYQALLKGAITEEFRKKFESSGWSSMSPPVVATPTR